MLNNLRKRETWLALLLMVVMLLSGIPCGAPVALAEDAAGGPGQVMSAVDSSPPAWPDAQLDVSNLTAESLTLTWSAATDDTGVTGYTVYQNGSPLASVTDETSYGVANLGAGTTYTFSIQAFDAAGNQSSDGPSRVETTLTAENLEEENPGKEGCEELPGGSGEGIPAGTGGLQVPGFLAGRQQAESATLVSAVSDHLGKKITLTFSKAIADPAGKQAQFTVAPNETAGTVSKAQLGSDPTQIVLSLSGYLGVGAAEVSYTAGDVQATDGTVLISFNDQAVVNNTLTVSPRMVNFDGAATEIAYNTSDPSNPVLQYRYDDPADYDNVNLAWYLSSGFFTPMVDDIVNYVSFYEKDTGAVVNLPNLLSRPNAPATYIDGRTINQQIVTDWTFWQISGAAPLGLNLVSQALKPSTTYVVELKQGFTFNNNATLPFTYQFEFTTTATSAGNPSWESGSALTASDVGDNGLTLSWPPASDNHGAAYDNTHSGQYIPNLSYKIYQNGTLLTTVDEKTTAYDVSNLSAGTSYQFKVEAVDFAGNTSSDSLEVTATTTGDAALLDPPVLTADSSDNTVGQAVDITFNDDSTWRSAVAGVSINGTAVSAYNLDSGILTIPAKAFTNAGDYSIEVTAEGYSSAAVTQIMNAAVSADTYTLTFMSDGVAYDSVTVASGTEINAPTDPTKENYTFVGWYADETFTTAVTFPYTVTADVTLYAKWTFNFSYTISTTDNTATIAGYSGSATDVVIPGTITDNGTEYAVTAIGNKAFYLNSAITAVSIPAGVTSIGTYAFYGCSSLTTVTLPDNLKNIGNYAFRNCTGLTMITLPKNLESIGTYAFRSCTNLSTVFFLGSQPTFGSAVFFGTASDFVLYYLVKNAASWAGYSSYPAMPFYTLTLDLQDGGANESSYVVVDNLGHIASPITPAREGYTFGGWYKEAECTNVFGFSYDTVSDDLTLYAKWLENTETKLTVTFMLDGGQYMALVVEPGTTINEPTAPNLNGAFGGWYSDKTMTTTVAFPYEVTSDSVFYGKTLAAVTFMSDGEVYTTATTNIGLQIAAPTNPAKSNYVFGGWYTDETFTAAVEFPYTVNEDVTIYAKWVVALCTITFISEDSTYFSVTNTVGTAINAPAAPIKADYAFAGWYFDEEYTTAVEFPYTPTSDVAFVTLYAKFAESTSASTYTVNFISDGKTYYSITKPEGTGIGAPNDPARDYYTFSGWYADETFATAITFPFALTADVTLYAKWTFNFSYTISTTDNTATITGYSDSATEVVIPKTITDNGTEYTVTVIGGSAFYRKDSLSSIIIPNSVTGIGRRAFENCTSLTSITIPNSVTSIGDFAFAYCTSLTSITLPDSVTSIERSLFEECISLSSITLPSGLTSIGGNAFRDCKSLKFITIPDSVTSIGLGAFELCTALQSITIPNGVTSIQDSLFQYCYSLRSITIPDSVTSIGHNAFARCNMLSSITIPSGITRIETYTFYGCAFSSITIPTGVTYIGSEAFNYCSNLTEMYFPGNQPTLDAYVFSNTSSSFVLYYHVKNAASWANFNSYTARAFCNLTLDLQDGSTAESSYAALNSEGHISAPEDPVSAEYYFAGWYKEAECSTTFDFSSETVADDLTLYAKWTADPPAIDAYTVTFINDGATYTTMSAASGSTIEAPTAPTSDYFTFTGWYADEALTEAVIFPYTVTGDVMLYAKWETVSPTLLLISAGTDDFGRVISLEFDRAMNDPSGKEGQFSVTVAGSEVSIKSVALGSDNKQINLYLSSKIPRDSTVSISYTRGDVQASDGQLLESLSGQTVTNNVLLYWQLTDYEPDATEIAYSNDTLTFQLNDLMDYDEVDMAMYLTSGFFETMEYNLNSFVKFYEKDTGEVVVLPNLVTEPHTDTNRYMEVTDWYFKQVSGRAPLGLNLVSRALKPSTTYVIEINKGFLFNNGGALLKNFVFEFTTTADSSTKPYWESGSELTASNVAENSLALSWPPASDNHGAAYENAYSGQYIPNLSYSIYQDGILLTMVSGSATSYDVTGLAAGTTYQFKVEAVDFANNRSAIDLEAWVTTAGAALLTPPAFSADSTDNTAGKAIDLTFSADAAWQAAITGITVNGASIAGQYSVSDGVITINGDIFATGGDYIIVVKATAYSDASVTQTIASDTAAPVWTSGELTASDITSHSLTLTWAGASDNTAVTGYKVYQGDTLLDTLGDVSAYSVTGLAADTQYTFTVQAGDAAGNWSTDGPSTTVTTSHSGGGGSNDTQAPTWPDNAAVTVGRTQTEATLTWPAAMDNKGVAGYRIKRDGTVISSVGGSITTYTDTGLERGNNTYVWSVEAFDESGNYSKAITGQSVPGQNPLSFIAAKSSLTTVNGSNSTNDGPIEGSTTVPVRPTIRLYFDRGVTTDAVWSCNSQCFTMQTGTGTNVPIDVFRLGSTDTINDNLRYIFISPKSALTSGESYKIIISKNLTANNGHTLGENNGNKDEEVTFTVAVSSGSSGGGGVSVTTSGPTSTTGSASVEPAVGATVGLGDMVRLVIPAHALQETGPVTVEIKKVASPPAIPTGFKVAGEVYKFSVGGKTVYSFAQSVALTFQFDPSQIGADEVPAVYYYDESLNEWVNLGGTVSGSTITVQVDHFTKYAVFSVKKPATPVVTPTPGTLNDISEHWAQNKIEELVSLGVISGYPDGSFKPDGTITRAEFATMLVKAFGLSPQSGKVFADTTGHWASDYIATAAANGLVSGYDAGAFGPDDLITREQIAVMMVKAAGLTMISEENTFADSSAISEWAKDSVATVLKSGLMKGYPDNSFQPLGSATRAEAVTVLANAL